ncbi:heparinase II/III family protein, partial [Massilia sp. YIM B04103]|uniref:heparinase II/III domain-containing protein n=1 Tax=Massilia sp. YIM B04103 TaxID=2963106 RepID=UPI00210A3459
WAAMHSKMADLTRTSVYFKSSPFGSFSHGHGDQNAFVISKAGIPLLTATGWYDWYDSPLARSWYRQTKAANAITFDGGTGQLIDGYRETLQRNGALTAFSTSAAIDYSEGNATAAYGGALSSAVRQLWFLRNVDAVVVRDALASAKARTYEWNFHALAPLTVSGTTVSVSYLGRSACVRPLVATGLRFEKRSGPPPRAGVTEDHGVFLTTTAQPAAEFLMLIDIGCKNPAVSLTTSASGRTLTVGGQSVALPR